MNPLKCAFSISFRKFLGFVVRHIGIKIDPKKITVIQDMLIPKDISELKCLQGCLAYIQGFISNLLGRCQPFARLMKKGVPFIWDQPCHNAFDSIKKIPIKPTNAHESYP